MIHSKKVFLWPRLKKAIRIPIIICNWTQVYQNILANRSLDHLYLRDGTRLWASPGIDLWNHYNSIWEHKTYTSKYEITQGGIVIDIGANIGLFSVLAAKHAKEVYSYEPFPESFSYLQRNVRENALNNVKCFQYAVAAQSGEVRLNLGTVATANSIYDLGMSKSNNSIRVRCTTLPDIFEENQIQFCDFLKLDCEGSEFEILLSTPPKYLSRILTISLEFHDHLTGHTHLELLDYLTRNGFAVEVLSSDGPYGILAAQQSSSHVDQKHNGDHSLCH